MRLAIVTHKFTRGDGQGRVNYELARAALAAGHTVWLVATEVAEELSRHPHAHAVRIPVAGLPSALLQNQLFAFRSSRWLRRHRRDFDLVHVNGFVSWSRADVNTSHFVHAAWLRSRFHTWRVRRDAYGLYQWLYSFVGAWLERWSYRRSAVVVAVSDQVRGELQSNRLIAERIRVIPNGVDLQEFHPPVTPVRADDEGGARLLFVGDIKTSRKNLDTLLRAMTRVAEATLWVVGSTDGSPYPRLAETLGLGERVKFLGFRRDIPELMRTADAFVFPSRYEACSLVLLEAAASGLPVVAGRTTGGAELLDSRCAILLEDPEDSEELAAALRRLLMDPVVRARMGAEARGVAERHSWRIMSQRYLELYREILAGGVSRCRTA